MVRRIAWNMPEYIQNVPIPPSSEANQGRRAKREGLNPDLLICHRTDPDSVALSSLSANFTRQQILKFAGGNFATQLESLIEGTYRASVRVRLQSNTASFDAFMHLSSLRWDALTVPTGTAALVGFLYMAIHQSVRQADQTQGRSEQCFTNI